MKIVQIAAEMAPFVKVGGLGDVSSALSAALAEQGHDVHVFLPFYQSLEKARAHDLGQFVLIPWKGGQERVDLWGLTDGGVNIVLLKSDKYFLRPGVYGEGGRDYSDNLERFALYCRASIEALKALGISPDVIHCHDWHASLVPVYLKALYSGDFSHTASVLTVHNLGYQGVFPGEAFPLLGLSKELFTLKALEFYNQVNILKGGIVFSDAVTTVSPTYAQEIQTEESGFGLDGVLREKGRDVRGILNGIDVREWNPKTDKLLPARYDMRSFRGKSQCKKALQETLGLDKDPKAFVAGTIARLVGQKGMDLLLAAMDEMIALGVQIVVLGRGDMKYEEALEDEARRHPGRAAVRIAFDNPLAHLIEAGSDAFLMPSKYEPCGLNQMMSLRYGTIPVVRLTGGLKDTITEFDPESGSGNGFTFEEYSAQAFLSAVTRALETFKKNTQWRALMKNGMKEDHSWAASAQSYASLYEKLLQ